MLLPKDIFYHYLTGDEVTVYEYTDEYLLLIQFARDFNENDYSLIRLDSIGGNMNASAFYNQKISKGKNHYSSK